MVGANEMRWDVLDAALKTTSARGCQLVMCVFIEFPGRPSAIPEFLLSGGLKTTSWSSQENGGGENLTPDDSDPKLRAALSRFIAALGEHYDGHPRLGYITAGLLGSWGCATQLAIPQVRRQSRGDEHVGRRERRKGDEERAKDARSRGPQARTPVSERQE